MWTARDTPSTLGGVNNDTWAYFKWLLTMSFDIVELPILGWACSLLFVGLLVAFAWQRPFGHGRWKPHYSLVLTQFLFFPAIVAVGALYGSIKPRHAPQPVNPAAELAVEILFFLSSILSFFWLYRMKGLRWFAFCLVTLQQVFLFGAALVADMSITGDWI
jgi:hypothetical protein